MTPEADGWWSGPDLEPGTDYGFLLDDDPEPMPDPASRWQPDGVHGPSRVYDQDAYRWQRHATGPGATSRPPSSTSCTSARSPRARRSTRAIERLDHLVDLGDHARRGAAGQCRQRDLELGLRRRRLVRGARSVRRPGRLQAVRRRLPRPRARRGARRRLQPPRSVRELSAEVRPVPEDRPQHVGRPGQPRKSRPCAGSSSTTR